jgi:hypothetical protein
MVLPPPPQGNWEAAQKAARGYLAPEELHAFYTKRARSCEANRQWGDAEKAYVAAEDVDAAIAMHRANRAWMPMLALVQAQRREQLPAMHLVVAQVGALAKRTSRAAEPSSCTVWLLP